MIVGFQRSGAAFAEKQVQSYSSHRHPFFGAVVVVVGGRLRSDAAAGVVSHAGVTPVYVVCSMQYRS